MLVVLVVRALHVQHLLDFFWTDSSMPLLHRGDDLNRFPLPPALFSLAGSFKMVVACFHITGPWVGPVLLFPSDLELAELLLLSFFSICLVVGDGEHLIDIRRRLLCPFVDQRAIGEPILEGAHHVVILDERDQVLLFEEPMDIASQGLIFVLLDLA